MDLSRVVKLKEAEKVFRTALRELAGVNEGSRPGDRRMALAFTKLDECSLWAVAALLDHHGA